MGLISFLSQTKSSEFKLTLEVIELQHIPLLNAKLKLNWKIKHAISTDDHVNNKGSTNYFALKDFKIKFNTIISSTISIPHHHHDQLIPSPLNLIINQQFINPLENKSQDTGLGSLILDLSQFINHNNTTITRRFLLNNSKTNATLKLAIKLEWIGGEPHYIPPPLGTGQLSTTTPTTSIHTIRKIPSSSSSLARNNRNSSNSSSTAASDMTRSSSSSNSINYSAQPITSKRGWHPSITASTAPCAIPGISGLAGAERSAAEIIDALFAHLDTSSDNDNDNDNDKVDIPLLSPDLSFNDIPLPTSSTLISYATGQNESGWLNHPSTLVSSRSLPSSSRPLPTKSATADLDSTPRPPITSRRFSTVKWEDSPSPLSTPSLPLPSPSSSSLLRPQSHFSSSAVNSPSNVNTKGKGRGNGGMMGMGGAGGLSGVGEWQTRSDSVDTIKGGTRSGSRTEAPSRPRPTLKNEYGNNGNGAGVEWARSWG